MPKVISWYNAETDKKYRAALIRVLAASKDVRVLSVIGSAIYDDDPDVRASATYSIMCYFTEELVGDGKEQHMLSVSEWWEKNKHRYLK